MFIVGLTGGIGSGKSAAAGYFQEHSITVVDADQMARVVVEPGRPALTKIADYFGPEAIAESGELDRAWLREQVFTDPSKREWLEALLHPLIREETIARLQSATSAYAILETPLLFETEQHELTNRNCVVDVPEDVQLARATARDKNNEQQIRAIMAAQMPREKRLERADDVIDNSGTLQSLQAQVGKLHLEYLALAARQ
ncbi:dephospho-CoA kinase [Biformimicrobium ophioploci]|uniref:Dephospho-CoA kinase n=1 Tax=Biformimicrobium ophioploci TaxID=3036711 RepID=A0ABQ6LX50_9GAMM|nr:dephospho-CoA kinase [Microbulbifer sp. NKW57]GMG86659.1 dephospho-CoA kinase [Microbulbifer sp. NKW57]